MAEIRQDEAAGHSLALDALMRALPHVWNERDPGVAKEVADEAKRRLTATGFKEGEAPALIESAEHWIDRIANVTT